MSIERLEASLSRFRKRVAHATSSSSPRPWQLGRMTSEQLIESMLLARHLDRLALQLRAEGKGHYTISSAGHEANAVLGRLTTQSDPTLLHYRSAAAQLERARQVPSIDAVTDIALSLVAAAEEPLCSGRHKIFGSKALGIIPQTSTIGSHLPRALGLAFALERRPRLGLPTLAPVDAITVVSFGDASLNHSTLQGTLNAASWVVHQRLKLPLLCVCEDNQLGISVQTPPDWVAARCNAQPHFRYFQAEMWQLDQTYQMVEAAVSYCRKQRLPALLHLHCRRLLGHAGSDVDVSYRSRDDIERAEACDPLLRAALDCIEAGLLSSADVLALEQAAEARVARAGELARQAMPLASRTHVMAPLAPPAFDTPEPQVGASRSDPPREAISLAQGINLALREILDAHPEALLFGEDVAKKGGVYGVTKGLLQHAGPARVFNTLLDEQTILGLALGTATLGLFPIPEIQYLAYLHNAEDQLRGEAATLRFFSNGAYDNPMLLRIAGLAYQKGFGGHFHNDNSLAVLRDIPGLVLGIPARADDATEMYRAARELVVKSREVVVMVEPIALYHERDLFQEKDGLWLTPPSPAVASLGKCRVYDPEARDLLLVSYGNGLRLCLRASRTLAARYGIRARTLDLRWLKPLPIDDVSRHLQEVGRALIVDECRRTASPSEELVSELVERNRHIPVRRVTSADSFVPLGEAAGLVLVSEPEIVEAARALVGTHRNS